MLSSQINLKDLHAILIDKQYPYDLRKQLLDDSIVNYGEVVRVLKEYRAKNFSAKIQNEGKNDVARN